MFDNLSERLTRTLKNIRGRGRLTEDNIKETLSEIRRSLLEADVALSVVKDFIALVRTRALGQEVHTHLNPGQALVKIVEQELITIMGREQAPLNLKATPPVVILIAGLQGSGKTTSVAKLARFLIENEKKSVLVSSADIHRPAAIAQLERLSAEVGANFHPSDISQSAIHIAEQAIKAAKAQFADVVIIDTAGRLHIDADMMDEIKAIHQSINPNETLFVVDSMTGQDAANTAQAFDAALPITGVILTKVDGDARGGAALSVRHITGKPIKFLGTGEKTEALEVFHPDRLASRILGMGDILSLVEEVERKVDKKKSEQLAKKIQRGREFNFEDFREQLAQMDNMGGASSLMAKLPGMGGLPAGLPAQMDDSVTKNTIVIINSMTRQERLFPKLLNSSRKKRIAQGSGRSIQEINRMLKQFMQMQKMMKKFSKPGAMKKLMRGLGAMKGSMPKF